MASIKPTPFNGSKASLRQSWRRRRPAACVVEVARSLASDSDRVLTLSALPPERLKLPPVAESLPDAVRRGGLGRCVLHEAGKDLRAVSETLYETFKAIGG